MSVFQRSDETVTLADNPSPDPKLTMEETPVFTSSENSVFRIPALFYHSDEKVLLAFAEKRKTKNDAHSLALVMRRGTVNEDKTVTFEESEREVVEKDENRGRPMNPCPVYETNTKTLFLFFIFVEDEASECWQLTFYNNKARLCYITSTDAGKNWSKDVHEVDEYQTKKNDWATFAVGPGHGLQTHDGTLIVPVHAYYAPLYLRPCCGLFNKPHSFSLFKKNLENTWKFGQMLQTNSGECEMAEFFDGDESRIYCNARSKGPYRVEAVSQDNGNEFQLLHSAGKLVETGSGCQGSVISFPAQPEVQDQKPKWLLYTHPTDPGSRKDLGVYLNEAPNDSNAWSKPWIINHGPSGYSDLAYMGDGWFACLVECGEESETEKIHLKVFDYTEVKQHV